MAKVRKVSRKVENVFEEEFNVDESNAVTLAAIATLNPKKLTFTVRVAIPATAAASNRREELLSLVSNLIDEAAIDSKEELQKYDPLYGQPNLFNQQPQAAGDD